MIKLPSIAGQLQTPRLRVVKPVLRPLRYPHAAEQRYAAVLLNQAKLASTAVRETLVPHLRALTTYAGKQLPRADDIAERLQELIAALRAQFSVSTREARRWAIEMLDTTNTIHTNEFVDAYGKALTVNPMVGNEDWLPQAMDVVLEENVGLIKSIPSTLFGDVEKAVSQAVLHGTRVEELALQIFQRFGVTENRAMLIARDQVGKWQGNLTRFRQLDAGITEYDWMTVGDERVRPTHRARDGKRYNWAVEPRPGQEVMCRCQAIPVIPDWEDEPPTPAQPLYGMPQAPLSDDDDDWGSAGKAITGLGGKRKTTVVTPTPTPVAKPKRTRVTKPEPAPVPVVAKPKRVAKTKVTPEPVAKVAPVVEPEGFVEIPASALKPRDFYPLYSDYAKATKQLSWGHCMAERTATMPIDRKAYEALVKSSIPEGNAAHRFFERLSDLRDPQVDKAKTWGELFGALRSMRDADATGLMHEGRAHAAMLAHQGSIKRGGRLTPTGRGKLTELRQNEDFQRAMSFYEGMADESLKHPTDHAIVFNKTERAHYDGPNKRILFKQDDVLVHEWGHGLDYLNEETRHAAMDFLHYRTRGEKTQLMAAVDPGKGYGMNEFTKRDKFLDAYVGKIYTPYQTTYSPDAGASEVTSMGTQYISKGWAGVLLAEDPEHFYLILGQLAGKKAL